ncbi:MAG: LacI family DNA-binding transcriptional regulator [Dehalococcoidia bacterium]
MTTIKDVAAVARVSPASVTRVLRGYPYVSDDLRSRVMEAVEACDYRPNLLASSLRIGQTHVVGLVLSTITNVTLAVIVDSLQQELAAGEFGVIVSSSHGDPSADVRGVERLIQRRVDALILVPQDETQPALLAALDRLTVPVLALDRELHVPEMSSILTDHFGGMVTLLQHLVDQGHHRIGLISTSARTFPGRERIRAFEHVAATSPISGDAELVRQVAFSESAGAEALGALCDLHDPPTAIVLGGSMLLVGAFREARCRNIEVGRDLAIAAGDDWPFMSLFEPGITALSRDLEDLGRRAASMVLDLLSPDGSPPTSVVFPMQLIVRASTGTWRSPAPSTSPSH